MPEWWTYRLADLILFSPDTYYRTFALYHHRIWPIHVIMVGLLAAAALVLARTASTPAGRGRMIAILLASWWAWTGLVFHLGSYATINWAARYFAAAFALQALVLLWYAGIGRFQLRERDARIGSMALIALAILSPMASIISGRAWDQVELPGLTPDPTAVATIALLRLAGPHTPRLGLLLPVAWCIVGGLTLYALGSLEAWWTSLAAGAALALRRRTSSG